jgi:hypothetical protein
MELSLAIRAFELMLGFSLAQQSLEYLRTIRLDKVNDWAILRNEIPDRPRWVRPLLDRLLAPHAYRGLLWLRLALSLALMSGILSGHAGLLGAAVLFAMALVLLLRWRGAFNGGSDFMTLVTLTGLLIAHGVGAVTTPELGWRAGLWYVTLQSITSYFVSGWVKLLHPSWRTGRALPQFLDTGIHGPLRSDSAFRRPTVARVASWSFTVWEGLMPLALLDPRLAVVLCAVAGGFHFWVFRFFGLNRFFWAWLSTFPAIVYCAGSSLQ